MARQEPRIANDVLPLGSFALVRPTLTSGSEFNQAR